MHSQIIVSAFVTMIAMVPSISAHGLILSATGNGGSGVSKALGVVDGTPRDGTTRNPFQQDTTRFANQRTVAKAKGLGSTLKGGANTLASFTGTQMAQVAPGGTVSMTLHQVNTDGAGPYTCMVDSTGTGQSFVKMEVTTQVPGKGGNNKATQKQDLPLEAVMPAGTQCTGSMNGMQNVCLVRCQNNANAGPFGGVVPVQMVTNTAGAIGGGNNVNTGNTNTGNTNTGNTNTGNTNTGTNNNTNNGNGNGGNVNNGNTNTNTNNGNVNNGNNNTNNPNIPVNNVGNNNGNNNNNNGTNGNGNGIGGGNIVNNGNTNTNNGNTNNGNINNGNTNNGNVNTGNTNTGNTNTGNTNNGIPVIGGSTNTNGNNVNNGNNNANTGNNNVNNGNNNVNNGNNNVNNGNTNVNNGNTNTNNQNGADNADTETNDKKKRVIYGIAGRRFRRGITITL